MNINADTVVDGTRLKGIQEIMSVKEDAEFIEHKAFKDFGCERSMEIGRNSGKTAGLFFLKRGVGNFISSKYTPVEIEELRM